MNRKWYNNRDRQLCDAQEYLAGQINTYMFDVLYNNNTGYHVEFAEMLIDKIPNEILLWLKSHMFNYSFRKKV